MNGGKISLRRLPNGRMMDGFNHFPESSINPYIWCAVGAIIGAIASFMPAICIS